MASFAAFGGMEDDEEDLIAYLKQEEEAEHPGQDNETDKGKQIERNRDRDKIKHSAQIPSDQELVDKILGPTLQKIGERAEAGKVDISGKVGFRILHKKGANAFAIGRRTIFLTRDLLIKYPEYLEAVILHEFGHMADESAEIEEWNAAGKRLTEIARLISLAFTSFAFFDVVRALAGRNLFFFLIKASVFGKAFLFFVASRLCLACCDKGRKRLMRRYRLECEFAADEYALAAGVSEELKNAISELGAHSGDEAASGKCHGIFAETAARDQRLSMIDDKLAMYYNK